ncbi:MAG: hypothetical protein ACREIA_23360 [Opitutaceae bacterium]
MLTRTFVAPVAGWIVLLTAGLAADVEPSLSVIPNIQPGLDDAWKRTIPGFGPRIAVVDRVAPGQKIDLRVFLLDPDSDPASRWTYRLETRGPREHISGPEKELLLAEGELLMTGHVVQALQHMSIVFDEADPIGKRRVSVVATDPSTGRTLRAEAELELVTTDQLLTGAFTGGDALKWLIEYFQFPRPHELPAVMDAWAVHPARQKPGARGIDNEGALLGFFAAVWADNPWLHKRLLDELLKREGAIAEFWSMCLAYALRDAGGDSIAVPQAAEAKLERWRGTNWPEPEARPTRGSQLDAYWGEFFATGRLAPVRGIVDALAMHAHVEDLRRYRESAKKRRPVPPAVLRGAVFGSAIWSLASNARQYRLVRAYAEGLLARDDLPEDVAQLLREALDTDDPARLRQKYR